MVLVGDIGGTKSRLALYDFVDGSLKERKLKSYVSQDFSGLPEIISSFLADSRFPIDSVCIGVPGPVRDGKAFVAKLDWDVDEQTIHTLLQIDKVRLVNDLLATAMAIPNLSRSQLLTLHRGSGKPTRDANIAVLAPGTGLGQAFVTWVDNKAYPHASEGGHIDFAPTSDLEVELLNFLREKYDRVSYERLISGPGLVNIYTFLKNSHFPSEHPELKKRFKSEDPAAVIAAAGLKKEFDICTKALDMFASILGAQAANLVLGVLALGGVYLGGGIPPKIANKLADGSTVKAYLAKGLMTKLIEDTPLYLIKDDHAALIGAAYLALEM